ncbi:MAG: putative glycoside hydrolase [Phycisphaerae bacterium]
MSTRPSAALAIFTAAVCVVAAAPAEAPPVRPDREDLARRIRGRTFPSVFQAWSPAEVTGDASRLETMARHDLVFHGVGGFGLRWNRRPAGLATGIEPSSIERGRAMRRRLLDLNPHVVLLAEIRYRDAHRRFLPDDHPWWRRKEGKRVAGWAEGGYFQMDFSNPAYRAHVARRAGAVVATGVVDGVMLDWWRDDEERLALVRAVREAVGPDALILVNANDRQVPRSAPYVNGLFMECTRSKTAADWARIARTLRWAESHLRRPHINCVETWYHRSRQDLHLMRATTALALTHSDGYGLFSDPNPLPTPDHRHDWYPFWEKGLGRPTGPGRERDDGVVLRPFTGGWAAYNPMGGRQATLSFPEPVTSRATGRRGRTHRLAAPDGDIYLRAPAD